MSGAAEALGVGTRLAGRFELVAPLGRGGMGIVFEALDEERGERVALKTLERPDPEAIHGLRRELRAAAALVHPRLVRLHELFADGDVWFFTMELVRGAPFVAHLRGDVSGDVSGDAPTEAPTEAPTAAPTEAPTEVPTAAPTEAPTDAPTEAPTEALEAMALARTLAASPASPAAVLGDGRGAEAALEEAITACDEVGLRAFAGAARVRLGQVRGEPALVGDGEAQLARCGVTESARFTAMLAPGW